MLLCESCFEKYVHVDPFFLQVHTKLQMSVFKLAHDLNIVYQGGTPKLQSNICFGDW